MESKQMEVVYKIDLMWISLKYMGLAAVAITLNNPTWWARFRGFGPHSGTQQPVQLHYLINQTFNLSLKR